MDLTLQFSAIPAILVVAGGLLVLVVGTPQNAGRRLLLYFLGVLAVTGLLVLLVTLLPVLTNNRPFINFGELIAPVAVGVLALVILHLGQVRGLTRRQLILAAAFLLVLIGVTVILWNQASILIVLGLALGVVTLWAGGLRFRWLLWGLCLVTLVSLVSYNDPVFSMIYSPLNNRTVTPLVYAFGLMNFAYPGLAVILAAVMIQLALKPAPEPVLLPEKPLPETAETPEEPLPQPTAGSMAPRRGLWRGLQVGLAVFLLAGLAYTTFWNSVWDDTSDGLGGLALMMLGTVVAVAAGMLMTVKSASWRRLAGLLFLVLVPVLLVQSFNHGWQVSYHAITEARAASIVSALERYHARTGAYPSRLADLTPRDLLVVLPPVVMRGQPWCYQGTASAYRLEAVYRETWGIPLKIKVYASAGEPLATDPACTAQLAALKTIYDAHFSEPQIPTPEPRQPLSVVPVPRQSLSTVVTGANLMPGAWSPDGRYLAFSRDSQLEFLDVNQGKECTSGVGLYGDADPHGTTAWLPDGRLLAVTTAGDLELATPCGSYEPLPGGGETTFSQVVASDPASGRILLKTDNAFWIMDGTLSSLTRLKGVTPNPYELRWDNAAWLAGGERLAIARMNAREGSAGSTLYVLDGQSGQVQLSLPWPAASSQSAPWVEWLNSSELLLNGGSKLSIVNVSTDPPKVIDVMHDLLKLDLAYPDEISAMTSVSDPATGNYYLAVRANHPRNVSLSLYSSATGKTQVFTSSDDYLLIFPNGEVDEMPRMPSVSSHQDQYDLLWVDQPAQTAQALSVAGHTPRSYPALYVTPAPGGDALYFGSSQGVSLVSFPEGKILAFWDLGGQTAYVTAPKHARAGQRVVAVVDRVGLFIIPLFK